MCKDERANASRLVVGWHENEWLPLAGSAHAKNSPFLARVREAIFNGGIWPVNGRWGGANNNGPPPKPEGSPKISESRLENSVWGAKFGGGMRLQPHRVKAGMPNLGIEGLRRQTFQSEQRAQFSPKRNSP